MKIEPTSIKINLIRNGQGYMNGYRNVDPMAYDVEHIEFGDHMNLDDIVEDAEATEFVARDIVDFLEPNQVLPAIEHWLSKIRHGGTLTLGGIDMQSVATSLNSMSFTDDGGRPLPIDQQLWQANALLHNSAGELWNMRKTNYSAIVMRDMMRSRGLTIESVRVDNYRYVVKGRRP